MAEVKWIKLTTTMFDDEKIRLVESMPEKDTVLIIWIKLLVLAGKCNNNGYIYLSENIPYNDEMLSTLFNRPLNSIRMALETFEKFGMIEIDDRHLIYISNWEKHQNIQGMERIKEQTKERVARHRAKQKELLQPATDETCSNRECNVTVTLCNATEREREEERDKEEDIDIEREKNTLFQNSIIICQYYESATNGKSLTPQIHLVNELVSMYDMEWIKDAIDSAIMRNKSSISYIQAILKNWTIEGKENKKRGEQRGNTRQDTKTSSAEIYDFSKYGG